MTPRTCDSSPSGNKREEVDLSYSASRIIIPRNCDSFGCTQQGKQSWKFLIHFKHTSTLILIIHVQHSIFMLLYHFKIFSFWQSGFFLNLLIFFINSYVYFNIYFLCVKFTMAVQYVINNEYESQFLPVHVYYGPLPYSLAVSRSGQGPYGLFGY